VCTAKGLVPFLNPVPDDAAAAMRAPRGHAFNCTFETVERHTSLTLSDDYRLVIVVSTHIARRHKSHLFQLEHAAPILFMQIIESVGASVRVSTHAEMVNNEPQGALVLHEIADPVL
jgi:hypothetical protein